MTTHLYKLIPLIYTQQLGTLRRARIVFNKARLCTYENFLDESHFVHSN
jgi:hypothetical protein